MKSREALMVVLAVVVLLHSVQAAAYGEVLVLTFKVTPGSIDVADARVRYGEKYDFPGNYSHTVEAVRRDGIIISSSGFTPYFYTLVEYENSTEARKFNYTYAVLRLKYEPGMSSVRVAAGGRVLREYNASLLCNLDGVCGGFENFHSCGDCGPGSRDGLCEALADGFCDADCSADVDCGVIDTEAKPPEIGVEAPQRRDGAGWVKYAVVLAVVVVAFLFGLWRLRSNA
ncbi:MAG: hypothetical protein HY544_05520 [Candidatus Diapherotrites archaeon]|uniref:Uncharacterized protein n=1 Tax=Candidatus Iainarchaeum sp. TaxID=3101447 RepID=A0A8T3YMI2_9ARCH|nr:hypothetical protein [Candidatus Diapherotrites archaeon]